jgi:hypothetical protein
MLALVEPPRAMRVVPFLLDRRGVPRAELC